VQKYKAAPEVYQLGPEAFGCTAGQLVFVSSNGWDACCATGFGYRTLWVNRGGDPVEQLGIVPAGEGRNLRDICRFIGVDLANS
jgi:2-haloacid dehalogenase